MTPFPRADYHSLSLYQPDKRPVEIDLSDNTNQWGTHPAALARMESVKPEDLRGYPQVYADELREAVAERYGVDPRGVTTGAGSDDVIDLAFRAAAGPGAVASYPGPTFAMIEPFARMNGIHAREIPWADALDDPARLLEGEPAVVYVCRPNNPTGEMASADWVRDLLDARGDEGPLVVLDEAYAEFGGEPLIEWSQRIPRLLVTRTASKAFGIAGLRCGFGVARPETALEVEKSRGPFKVSVLAAAAFTAALRDESDWLERTVAECVENRGRVLAALRDRGLRPFDSRTNFVLFAAPSGNAREDAQALREIGVAARPFSRMPVIGEALRATVGRWPQMERLIEGLDVLIARARGDSAA